MKIATWNVNSLRVRLPQVLDWLEANPVDVLALQETKLTNDQFPVQRLREAGYRAVFAGQKTYNGVAIVSRRDSDESVLAMPQSDDPQMRYIAATCNGLRVINVYVPNGAEVGSAKYRYKLQWLKQLHHIIGVELRHYPNLVVVGDFNIAPTAADVHDPAAWEGKVLFSEAERDALGELIDLGLCDSFRLFQQPEATFSWWDYRTAAFRRNAGLRIDHILVNPALAGHCRACRVDVEPRRWQRPSDHAPVIAQFEIDNADTAA